MRATFYPHLLSPSREDTRSYSNNHSGNEQKPKQKLKEQVRPRGDFTTSHCSFSLCTRAKHYAHSDHLDRVQLTPCPFSSSSDTQDRNDRRK